MRVGRRAAWSRRAWCSTLAAGIKASAGLVVPFLLAAGPLRRVLAGAAAGAVAILVAAYAGFGGDALDALGLLSDNQERTSRWSFPYKTAQLLGAILPGDRLDYRDAVRAAYAVAFARRRAVAAREDLARSRSDPDGRLGDARPARRLGMARAVVRALAAAAGRAGGATAAWSSPPARCARGCS